MKAKLDSPEAFRDGILKPLDPAAYATMKSRLKKVGPRYDWKVEGEKLAEIVGRVCSSSR